MQMLPDDRCPAAQVTRRLVCRLSVVVALVITMQPAISGPVRRTPLTLWAWPTHVYARHGQLVNLRVALENVTEDDIYVRLWFRMVPFGHGTYLKALRTRCVNVITHRQAGYIGFPPGRTTADVSGLEPVEDMFGGCFTGAVVRVDWYYQLPPGEYALEMQYNTTYLPTWIRPDKRAWHGATNIVTVRISIKR